MRRYVMQKSVIFARSQKSSEIFEYLNVEHTNCVMSVSTPRALKLIFLFIIYDLNHKYTYNNISIPYFFVDVFSRIFEI